MYKVKVTKVEDNSEKMMLCRSSDGRWVSKSGKYRFYINEEVENPDFWVVRNKSLKKKETCYVAPENTLLVISEPKSIFNYPEKYRNQFAMLCSCQEELKHRNIVYTPAMLPWFVRRVVRHGKIEYAVDNKTLEESPPPPKTKLISVITSNKAFTGGHQARIDFVEKLKAYYGRKLDVFGHGFNDFDDKWDVLAPYKYHIAIENSSSRYYWTEKLSDSYLAGTFPFYYGCTNLNDYFPESSFKFIDIYDFDAAVKIIDQTIADDGFGKNREVLKQCKRLVMDDYNMFNIIADCCDKLNAESPRRMVTLKPAISMLDLHNIYLYTIERSFFNLKRFFKNRLFRRN